MVDRERYLQQKREYYQRLKADPVRYEAAKKKNTENNRRWAAANREKKNEYQRAFRERHPDYDKKKAATWAYQLKRWEANGYPLPTRPRPERCEACNRTSKRSLHLDHCHKTMRFRGWLCSECNTTAGKFNDDPVLLRALADYLEASGG